MQRFGSLVALVLGGLVAGLLAVVLVPAAAQAHVERPSYWPDPQPDCSVSPCAGGAVPEARSLPSALDSSLPGRTRVVCKADSLQRLDDSVAKARRVGFYERPTVHHSLSAQRAATLLRVNRALFARCAYHDIQAAVTASHNNDRVVVMPGLYLEKPSRAKPTYDATCAQYKVKSDGGDPGALSHDYQVKCPNDANLVAVIGRGMDTGTPPSPGLVDRHGIPDVGKCIRCNVQLEGSGVSADDVVVEAGDPKAGDGGPSAVGHAKDVGIFVDRADGFVLRNLTVRHAREHDIYILETDGYLFDKFKAFYAGGYGVLTFVEDHGVIQHCEAAGNGDSGIYPGAGADSTDQRYTAFYPTYRFSQTVRYCDSHHNTGGFSGTDSHGTLITHNNFYDNSLGFTTDVFTAPGHPGFPQHGNVVRENNFYSNNFNPYVKSSDVAPFIASPVGTGLWFAGGNNNKVVGNAFWNNWRRGMMLFAVPDATVCGPPPVGSSTPVPGCNPLGVSTSFGNQTWDNTMGVDRQGHPSPNGVDFWWDAFLGNTGNCWWGNTGPGGAAVTSAPATLPNCANGTDPSRSTGTSDVVNEAELAACMAGFTLAGYPNGNGTICNWTTTPSKPGAGSARLVSTAPAQRQAQEQEFSSICQQGLAPRLCTPFNAVLGPLLGALPTFGTRLPDPFGTTTAAPSEGRLSTFTCDWWRRADRAHRLGMVQRLRHFATMPINGTSAESRFGYGAGLPDDRAAALLDDRCGFSGAGAFALYKIYGAAAAFSAATS